MKLIKNKFQFQGEIIFSLAVYFILFTYVTLHLNYVISAGDGVWILYANQVIHGASPYRDLGYFQQPLFLLFSIPAALLYKYGIFFSKLYYLIVPYAYILILINIVRLCGLSRSVEALLCASIFFVLTYFNAYRFDDYHAFAHIFVLFSLLIIIRYENNLNSNWQFCILQTICIALCFLTRINEGVALSASIFLYVYFRRVVPIGVWMAIQILVFIVLLFLLLMITGDSIGDWYTASVAKAAQIKGGLSLLDRPKRLLREAFNTGGRSVFALALFACMLFQYSKYDRAEAGDLRRVKCVLLMGFMAIWVISLAMNPSYVLQYSFVLLILIITYRVSALMVGRDYFIKNKGLLLIYAFPFFLFLTGSLSSGGYIDDLWFPLGVFYLVLLYECRTAGFIANGIKVLLLIFFVALGLKLAAHKIREPYIWHSYSSPALWQSRILSKDGREMPVVIDNALQAQMENLCSAIPREKILFSLPFSFPNYFCGNPLWMRSVQLFFDTSSKDQARIVIGNLEGNPPEYLVYQLQMVNLVAHENRFNGGRPLPFRSIHEFIMNELAGGRWHVTGVYSISDESVWLVIKTK